MEIKDLISIEYPNLTLFFPELIVLITGFVLFTLDIISKRISHALAIGVSITGYLIALLYILLNFELKGETFYSLYVRDQFSSLLQVFMILLTILLLAFTHQYQKFKKSTYSEFYYILAFSLFGAMILSSSYNLLLIYIALEAVSVSFYIMTALQKGDFNSKEGAFKYLILGGLSIALASYGAVFLYLYGGSMDLRQILHTDASEKKLLILGLILFLFGFAIKIGVVPFHFWLPDAYQGAPTPITAYMASVGKIAFFAPVLRVMPLVQESFHQTWVLTLSVLAVITFLYGNITALVQKDVKRMLAYSSIAHSGFILAGIAVAETIGLKAVIYFLLAYSLMGMLSFLVLAVLERDGRWENRIEEFSGLRYSQPFLASVFAVSLFSLLGVPPTVGFLVKALVFMSLSFEALWWVAILMIGGVGISTGYYLRLVVLMFMKEKEKDLTLNLTGFERLSMAIMTLSLIVLGILPMILWNYISPISEMLFGR
ncbi:NADH-quinone oxidoreductase subunit N [Thermocrinis jamiesonii]|uniref:NADH-quinone oxidoreductase subunit N n=1 Tax=Thermocrinis jamiesonii TaxID=1302351 RepID=UPI0004955E60|nr:NADH-quinone oxidoreductase subunit N [Thermocrinis jamiesonii]